MINTTSSGRRPGSLRRNPYIERAVPGQDLRRYLLHLAVQRERRAAALRSRPYARGVVNRVKTANVDLASELRPLYDRPTKRPGLFEVNVAIPARPSNSPPPHALQRQADSLSSWCFRLRQPIIQRVVKTRVISPALRYSSPSTNFVRISGTVANAVASWCRVTAEDSLAEPETQVHLRGRQEQAPMKASSKSEAVHGTQAAPEDRNDCSWA